MITFDHTDSYSSGQITSPDGDGGISYEPFPKEYVQNLTIPMGDFKGILDGIQKLLQKDWVSLPLFDVCGM